MTRRNLPAAGLPALGGLAALLVLWCAWRILGAGLTWTTGFLAWGLWLVLAASVVTAAFYVRELAKHRVATRGGAWRPLPSLVLLWIAGVTSVGVFAFMLPSRAESAAAAAPAPAAATVPVPGTPTPAVATTTAPTTAAARASATTASRSQARVTPTPLRTTAALAPQPVSTVAPAPARSTTTPPAPSPTSSPLITIRIPGHGSGSPTH